MPFLELKGVAKGYGAPGRRTEVLRDINLGVERGEFVALVGYSGAGKSTLLSMVAGLSKPDAGTITLGGKPISEPGRDRGVIFQNYSLLPWMTVFDNVALAVDQVFPEWPAAKRREHVLRYIEMVSLTPARDKRPRQLSGGMRQRVSVARALAMEPEILLMDEPLSALDALTRATLQDEIVKIWEKDPGHREAIPPNDARPDSLRSGGKKTVLLITNDVDEGVLMADRIIPLGAGPNATLGPAQSVGIARPRNRQALNHEPRFKEIRGSVIAYLLDSAARRKRPASNALAENAAKAVEVNA
jgi:nitrate/nitrite transport system ATP-binding protein